MTIGLAVSSAARARGRPGMLPVERPAPEAARPRPAPAPKSATGDLSALRLERVTSFMIHQLLAAAPELGLASPSRPRTLAAYQAQLAQRVRYFGPVLPVDLRV